MTETIPEDFQYAGKRKVMKQGNSTVIGLPKHIIESEGLKRGDGVKLYSNGNGQILIDLKPDEE
ncbi:MAG: AbrB/MazE/SpoVT family DNA-binding domain-containing protein [Candidatus Thorarchaeota archaeon]